MVHLQEIIGASSNILEVQKTIIWSLICFISKILFLVNCETYCPAISFAVLLIPVNNNNKLLLKFLIFLSILIFFILKLPFFSILILFKPPNVAEIWSCIPTVSFKIFCSKDMHLLANSIFEVLIFFLIVTFSLIRQQNLN